MLPIINIPAIHLVVEEALHSGIDDIIIITARGKRAIEDYFDASPELEAFLVKNNKDKYLKIVREISSLESVHYIRQKEPTGLGDAVLHAERHIGDDPFAVLLGDDIVVSIKPCIQQLSDAYYRYGHSVIAVEEVPRAKVSSYGIIKGTQISKRIIKIEDIIEKPRIEAAPSRMGVIGRYVFESAIFDSIRKSAPNKGNEIQIADGINHLNKIRGVLGYRFSGTRYDIGDKAGYVRATIDFALKDDTIRDELLPFLRAYNPEKK